VQHLGQAGLVDRALTLAEAGDLLGILVDRGDIVAALGKANGGDETDVATTNDRDLHAGILDEQTRLSL
jgi:hypothetical protein